MEPGSYEALDARLRRVEAEAAALRSDLTAFGWRPQTIGAPAAAAPLPRAAPPPPAGAVPAPPVAPLAPARPGLTLEGLVAGRGLQIAGLFLVLLGAAFFLNLAFTRGWIGPAERIMLGLVAGGVLILAGARLTKPAQVPVAESLIALGSGILYLSLWAAVAVFPQLHVPRVASFAAMIAVTTVLAVLAGSRRSERIALLGLAGGFLTPLLLSSTTPDRTVLATYLLVLAGSFAALGVVARFRFVETAAFAASMLYLPTFAPAGLAWTVPAAYGVTTALFALFAAAFAVGVARDGATSPLRVTLLTIDVLAYSAMLAWIFDGRQTQLGIAFIVLAAALLAASRFVPTNRTLTNAFGYLGLGAATLALPALLHRTTLLDAFAVEGALLIAIGARRTDRTVTGAGAAILGFASIWLFGAAFAEPAQNTAFSSLALAFAITVGALAFARTQLARVAPTPQVGAGWTTLAVVTANVIAVTGISRLLLDALGGPLWHANVPSHAQVAVSLAWTAYAAASFGLGLQRNAALLRHLGLVLFGLTIFKVLSVDLSNVDVTWRIASASVLGLVCIAVSAWYMRAQAAAKAGEG